MDAFWACDGCHSLNRQRDDRCYHCRAPRASTAMSIPDGRAAADPSRGGWRSVAGQDASAALGVVAAAAAAGAPAAGIAGPSGGAGSVGAGTIAPVPAPNTLAGGVAIATDPGSGGSFGPFAGYAGGGAAIAGPAPGMSRAAGGDSGTSLLGALILGAGAALAATALWFGVVSTTHIHAGFVAIAVGWLVAQGVVWGGGGRGSVALIPISVTLTFLALAASEYLIVVKEVGDALTEAGIPYTLDVIQPPDVVLEAIKLSLQFDPLTLLFWAIAIGEAFIVPLRRLARPT